MFNRNTPKAGSLLISEPFMLDLNFQRSVVLLCEHDGEDGTLGYILNQPINVLLHDVLDIEEGDPNVSFPLYFGGPVAQDSIHFVHNCYDKLNSGIGLGNGLFWGGNFETLKILIQREEIAPNEVKFFLGYSGWSVGQLEAELKENAWVIGNDYNPEIAFVKDGEDLWKESIIALGPKYAHVANFPQNPMWN